MKKTTELSFKVWRTFEDSSTEAKHAVQLVECLPGMQKAREFVLILRRLGVVIHTRDPSAGEVEEGGSEV